MIVQHQKPSHAAKIGAMAQNHMKLKFNHRSFSWNIGAPLWPCELKLNPADMVKV